MTLSLTDALSHLAAAGCRILPQEAEGLELDVPPGANVSSEVLDVLAAHREQLAAAFGLPAQRPPLADDGADPEREALAEYLAKNGVRGSAAELVMYASDALKIRLDDIRVKSTSPKDEVEFFAPGIPVRTKIDTRWHEPGRVIRLIPARTVGLAIPQPWAISNDFDRKGVLAQLAAVRRKRQPSHIGVWLANRPRVMAVAELEFDPSIPTEGLDLMPWRQTEAVSS
jgi:hypothetical protein